MGSINLKIQRVLLEITNSDELNYKNDEIEISNLIKSALPKVIEEILGNENLKFINFEIPRLEIDLGWLSKPTNEEIINLLKSKLSPILKKELESTSTNLGDNQNPNGLLKEQVKEGDEIDILLFFLKNGYLPWYANNLPSGSKLNDNNLIIRVRNFMSAHDDERVIQRFLSQYDFKDIVCFTSELVSENSKSELEGLNQIISKLLKSNNSIAHKLANELKRQTLLELIRNSGQLKPAKNLVSNFFVANPEFQAIIEKSTFNKIENSSADNISLIIEEALMTYEKRKEEFNKIENPVLNNSVIRQMILYYLSNGSIPNNLQSLNKTDFFKYLRSFILSNPNEVTSIYRTSESKQLQLTEILLSLPDDYLSSVFQYYVKENSNNDLQTNEFVVSINTGKVLTQQEKLVSSIIILEHLVNKKIQFSKIIERSKILSNLLISNYYQVEEEVESRIAENSSTDDISLMIESPEIQEKRKTNSPEIENSSLKESDIQQMILDYLSNGLIPNNLQSLNKTDFFKYLRSFILSNPNEVTSIYRTSESKQLQLTEILLSLPNDYLSSVFQYYVKENSNNDLQTNEFIVSINSGKVLTQQEKIVSSIIILEHLINKKIQFSEIIERSKKVSFNTITENSDKLEKNNVINDDLKDITAKKEHNAPLNYYYFNDLLSYYFENGVWPWWIDNYIKVYGNLNFKDSETSLISILDNYKRIYPKQFTDFTLSLISNTNNAIRIFSNLPWEILKMIVNQALPGIKNKFSDTIEAILKHANREMGINILPELSAQKFVYRILKNKNLISLGYVELINLLVVEFANQLSIPLWQAYSLIVKKYQDLELPNPLTKDELDSILIYNKEREEQFVQIKENLKLRKDILDFYETNNEFISDKHEELIFKFIKGENVNLNFFPSSYSLREFILERVDKSNLFLTKLYEIVLSQKNNSLNKLIELEHIVGHNLLELVLKTKENKNILDNLKNLLSDVYPEIGNFLIDNLRIALVNESIWLEDAFSKEILNRVLHRLSINLNVEVGILETSVLNKLSNSNSNTVSLKEQFNIDNSQIPIQNSKVSSELFSKINYERDLLNELFNFIRINYIETEIQFLISNILLINGQSEFKECINPIKDDVLKNKVLSYIEGLNNLAFNYFLASIKLKFGQVYNAVNSTLKSVDEKKISLEALSKLQNVKEFLTQLFEFLNSNYDKKRINILSSEFNKIESKRDIKEWINNINDQNLKITLQTYIERINNQEFKQLTEAAKIIFIKLNRDEYLPININDQKIKSLLLDFLENKLNLLEYEKFKSLLAIKEYLSIEEFTETINSISNINLAEILRNIIEGKISIFEFHQLINLDKIESLTIGLEFWKSKLDFKSQLVKDNIQSLSQTNINANDYLNDIDKFYDLDNNNLLDIANENKSSKSSVLQQNILSFIDEQNKISRNAETPSQLNLIATEILSESELSPKLNTFYNPESIAEILSYFLIYFELPWWSAIKDIKELEKIIRDFSSVGNNLFRQKITQFVAHYPEKFTNIIEEIYNEIPVEFSVVESKIKLETELRNDLDFLSAFVNSLDNGDKLMPYLNIIVSDFRSDNYIDVKQSFRKLVLTTLINFNPQTIFLLEKFNQNVAYPVALDYTTKAKELGLHFEIKSKEVENVHYFLNELESSISVNALNEEISITHNLLNLYNRSDKISVKQLLQVWLNSIELIKKVPSIQIKQQILEFDKNFQIDKSKYVAKELLEIVRQDKIDESLITLPYISFINIIEIVLSRLTNVSVATKKESLKFLSKLLSTDHTLTNLPLYFNLFIKPLYFEGVQKEKIIEILIELKREFIDSNLNYIIENIILLMEGETMVDKYALMNNQKSELTSPANKDADKMVSEFLEQFNLRKDLLENLSKNDTLVKSKLGNKKDLEAVKRKKPLDLNLDERIYIPNAGLVILWPFLSRLFSNLKYTEKGKFLSPEKRTRAIYLSQYLVGFTEDNPEYTLMLNKLLCGMELNEPIEEAIRLTDEEKAETRSLLSSVIAQWKEMNNTSVENFQRTFLQREGVMFKTEENWNIVVGKSTFDVLLLRLPWGMSIIKYSWNNYLIFVEWKAMT